MGQGKGREPHPPKKAEEKELMDMDSSMVIARRTGVGGGGRSYRGNKC